MESYALIVLMGCLFAVAASGSDLGPKPDGGEEATSIQGKWICASAVIDGRTLADKDVAKLRLIMTAQRYRTERGEEEVLFDSTYTLDPTRDPRWIEMVGTEGDARGKPALGIYLLEGDTLSICYTMPGAQRPNEFKSPAGSGRYFITWRRIK